jgi:DNA-binding NarL/FixJ family response regulator
MTEPLRVLLADDHAVFRKGLSALLTSLPEAVVIGEASDGAQAVRLCADLLPDLVVMDVNMPELDGIEATRQIVAARPATRVLVLTMFDDDESVFAAMRAGAGGYLVKGSDTDEVVRAITAVANGEAIFGPSVARRILAFLTRPLSAFDTQQFPQLSSREREVLHLIAAGVANADIARRLFLSPKTVRNHVSSIFTKLQVADRAQAIVQARAAGMGREPGDLA